MTEGLGPNGYEVFDPVGDAIRAAARDARRAALEEAAKVATSFVPANPLNHIMSQAIEDHGRVIEAAIRALIDREPTP